MKKLVLFSLLFLLLAAISATSCAEEATAQKITVGESVFLGHYEQDNRPENGAEPIEWTVLSVEDEKALVISRYALDCQPFNTEKKEVSWAESSLRAWLNNTFLHDAFNDEEKKVLVPSIIKNGPEEQNPEWAALTIGDTADSAFLLSFQEVKKYFPSDRDRKASGTEFARAQGAKFLGVTTIGTGDTDWWLRSPGSSLNEAAYVGVVRDINKKTVTDRVGIRPVIRINLTLDRSFFPYEQFEKALQYENEGRYEEAANIYEALGTYNDSENSMKRAMYQQAQKATIDGDYKTALRLYESIGNYADSFLQGRACRFNLAVQYQEAGDYKAAAPMFEKAGQYKDSMQRLRDCYEKLGISIYYFDADAVSAGVDTGYSKSEVISGNDKHFGWSELHPIC